MFGNMEPGSVSGQSYDACNGLDRDLMNYLGNSVDSCRHGDEVDFEDVESSGITLTGDSESVATGISAASDARTTTRQTRSKRTSSSKRSQLKTQCHAGKNKAADVKNSLVGTPRVVLRERRPRDRCADISAKQSLGDLSALLSDDDIQSNDREIENVHTCPKTRSKGQKKVSKTVPKSKLSSSGDSTTTSTRKTDQNRSESDNTTVTSVKLLRIVRSGIDRNSEENVIAKALEERSRKNAEMAKAFRIKKKAYLENLEKELGDSREKIDELRALLNDAEVERDSLKEEVEYLRAVLANQSVLGELLKNIPNVSGATLSSSLSRKRAAGYDCCPHTAQKRVRTSTAGVCLHVDGGGMSLELCHHCARMAHVVGKAKGRNAGRMRQRTALAHTTAVAVLDRGAVC